MKAVDEKYCSECGVIIRIKAEICPNCGVRQLTTQSFGRGTQEPRNKTTAALLAIFLGGLGMHKFYLGKPWIAVIYIVFCLTFIPSLVALIEGIAFLSMTDERFSEKYPS